MKPVDLNTAEQLRIAGKLRIAASLWRRCELDWKLEPQQLSAYTRIKAVMKSENNRFVLNASRRWGKSYLLGVLALEFALANPNVLILYAASTQKQVKDILLPTLRDLIRDCPEDLRPQFKTQLNRYNFPNGSAIKLAGLDGGKLDKIRGITAHMILVDEAGFAEGLQEAVQSVLAPMAATTKGPMILSSNSPTTPGHDFVKIFTREAEACGNFLKQTVYDVPKFTASDIDRFARDSGGYDSPKFKREYLGEYKIDENNAVIPEFSTYKTRIVREIQRPEFFFPLVAIDLGFIDHTGVLFGYWNFVEACGVIEDELLLRGTNSERLVRECHTKEADLWGEPIKHPVRVADGQLYTINDITTVHKYPVGMVSKSAVETQANAVRIDIQGGKLLIHPRCVHLIGHLEDAVWNKARTSFGRDSEQGHFDLLAALQYMVRHFNRHSNPFPAFYGLDTRNMRLRDTQKNHSPSLQSLKNLWGPKTEESRTPARTGWSALIEPEKKRK